MAKFQNHPARTYEVSHALGRPGRGGEGVSGSTLEAGGPVSRRHSAGRQIRLHEARCQDSGGRPRAPCANHRDL